MDTIKVQCPHCGRTKDDAPRAEWDPPQAALMVIACECQQGCKIESADYYDADGNWIDWYVWSQSQKRSRPDVRKQEA